MPFDRAKFMQGSLPGGFASNSQMPQAPTRYISGGGSVVRPSDDRHAIISGGGSIVHDERNKPAYLIPGNSQKPRIMPIRRPVDGGPLFFEPKLVSGNAIPAQDPRTNPTYSGNAGVDYDAVRNIAADDKQMQMNYIVYGVVGAIVLYAAMHNRQ